MQKSIPHKTMASMTNSRYASENFCDKKPTEPAIVIPRVFKNITQQRILAIFGKLDLGDIVRIDMVPRTNERGEEFWRVFVHLAWAETENGTAVRTKLMAEDGNGEVKIVYDDPWFWKLRASRPAPAKENKHRSRPAPFIKFEPASKSFAETLKQDSDRMIAGFKTEEAKQAMANAYKKTMNKYSQKNNSVDETNSA